MFRSVTFKKIIKIKYRKFYKRGVQVELMRKKTCLITGAAGFIGSSLAKALIDKGYDVIGVDNFQTGNRRNIEEMVKDGHFRFFEDDINEYKSISEIFFENKIDYVFHYAATVGVQLTLKNPLMVYEDIKGLENILSLSRHAGVKRVVYASSSEVYGEAKEFPMEENNTPLNSRLPYAIVKNLGESFLKTYSEKFGLDHTIIRLFNTYGPRQSDSFVVSKFIRQALNDKDITLYGDGGQTRTFFYVDDHVNFVTSLIDNPESVNQTINLGGDEEIGMVDLGKTIIRLTDSKSKIVHLDPLIEGDMSRRKPDVVKMNSFYPNAKKTTLEEGLNKTIEYFRKL